MKLSKRYRISGLSAYEILIAIIIIIFVFLFLWRNYYTNSYVQAIIGLNAMAIRQTYIHNPYQLLGKSPPPIAAVSKGDKVGYNGIYGGVESLPHLGGWTDFDPRGVSNMTWDYMIAILGVKSLLDIGCGRGYSTNYFLSKGVRVLCIEGSHAAIINTHLPSSKYIVEHDYSLGPYWPDETFDACWSVEFLEHVSRQYFKNYINSFRQCALIFITKSPVGGHHHVEVHGDYWWKGRFIAAGMVYFQELTEVIRRIPYMEKYKLLEVFNMTERYNGVIGPYGQYIEHQMMVFINPIVASLPQHDHIFSGEGCHTSVYNNADGGVPCKGQDVLPEKYNSLMRCFRDPKKMALHKLNLRDMYWTCHKRKD